MTPRLSGHFSIFDFVFFVLKSLLGIARQWSRKKKIAILSIKPWGRVRILLYIVRGSFSVYTYLVILVFEAI